MERLLLLLALFFRPAVDGDPEDPPADPADPAPDPDPDPQPELDLDATEDDPAPKVEPKEELEAERRARQAERDRADRFEREAADLRARQAPRQDDEAAREDAKLNDPNTPPLEKWQIQANRELRAGRTAAQAALAQAADIRDQTAFNHLAVTEPALHKRYAVKVEQELSNARRQGFNPNREFIYNQLIAKDMRDGKFKKKAAAPAAGDKKGVDRGRLPGARGDVSGKGQMSNRERLAQKLKDVPI